MSWIVITTASDRSTPHFESPGTSIRYYGQLQDLPSEGVDVVYFRDPFNEGSYDKATIEADIETVCGKYSDAYYVDNVRSFDDLLFEDKWRQYQLLESYCPKTWQMDNGGYQKDNIIIKKRISSRARDITFSEDDVAEADYDQYIVQERLSIEHEFRVYSIGTDIIPMMSRKSSKTETVAVKVQDVEPLRSDIKTFVESISSELPQFNFLGFDIAETEKGLMLIEVNRSPQFAKFNELAGMNAVEALKQSISRGGNRRK